MMAETQTCGRCSDNFITNNKLIVCRLCSVKFHVVCVHLEDTVAKIVNDVANLFWLCDGCVTAVEGKLQFSRRFDVLEANIDRLLQQSSEVLEIIKGRI